MLYCNTRYDNITHTTTIEKGTYMLQNPNQIKNDKTLYIHLLPAVHQFAYEQENILLYQVKTKRFPAVNETLNHLLGYTLVMGKNSLLNSKQRVSEFYSVMARVLIETGANEEILSQFHNIYHKMQAIYVTYDELCETAQQMAGFFIQCIRTCAPLSSGQSAVCQSRGYMARHYASRITLAETAAYVHLNPAYFSSLFKKTTGISFKEYLNRIRVEESKLLLKNSNYEIIDIAVATGFEDQSYFTKIFSKYTNMTPGQFRFM